MKPLKQVKDELLRKEVLEREINTLAQLQTETEANLAKAEATVDLFDKKALQEIAQIQVLAAILPKRRAHREGLLVQQEETLREACRSFLTDFMQVRLRNQIRRARELAEERMRELCIPKDELEKAISQSVLVKGLVDLTGKQSFIMMGFDGRAAEDLVGYCEELLKGSEAFDAKLGLATV